MDDGRAVLVLDDGTTVEGRAAGASRTVYGELVFTTGMTGYQEALTDPSYRGQLLMFTYPLIGNYGVDLRSMESGGVQATAAVAREFCAYPSHRNSEMTVSEFLRDNGAPGISGLDTRALTILTRERGTMRAALVVGEELPTLEAVRKTVRTMDFPDARNLVGEVSIGRIITHKPRGEPRLRIGLLDCGVKASIISQLTACGALVVHFPYDTPAETILEHRLDGLLISNGPGDPAHPRLLQTTVPTLRTLAPEFPLMGICLGHQLLHLAFGGHTFKLKFGHRGVNQPVQDLRTGRVYITSQNHGFAAAAEGLGSEIEVTQANVNDGTVEGLRHTELPIWSVQYHPEASPGPRDTRFLFETFAALLRGEDPPLAGGGPGGSHAKA